MIDLLHNKQIRVDARRLFETLCDSSLCAKKYRIVGIKMNGN